MKKPVLAIFFFFGYLITTAQEVPLPANGGFKKSKAPAKVEPQATKSGGRTADTLGFEHRDDRKDSVSISYRYLDSTRRRFQDSTINDFDNYFQVPSSWYYLGNSGAAAFPIAFKPNSRPGFDPGFHAYDVYRYTLENTRFYKTNKPFSMITYQLASGKEQIIEALHTQNPKPNMNFGINYKLISAPGFFVTQNTNHSIYRLFGNYTGNRKRYSASVIILGNTIRASENGGITNDTTLSDPNRKERFAVPVNLGGDGAYEPSPFVSTVETGNTYRDFVFFLRQGYDFGKEDSLEVNDSTMEYLFYPKLRLQHTFTYNTQYYKFSDIAADSIIYGDWYGLTLPKDPDTFLLREKWQVITNDFSLIQFPDTRNSAEFLQAGVTWQSISQLLENKNHYDNIFVHGEYRNRSRNKVWDILLKGEFYASGLNSGDYSIYASLGKFLNRKFGDVQLYFRNVNRTPSYIFDARSSFSMGNAGGFNKENITSFGATATNPFITFGFHDHLITNYAYFLDYYHTAQSSPVINLFQAFANKTIKLTKRWNWYLEMTVQQVDGAAPIKVPLFFTRNRFAYEGVFFKNLNLSTGIEARYNTPYHMNNYSPVMGQFSPQDTMTISNLPDIAAFLHFRIKGFTAFTRLENFNTVSFSDGFGFTNNNFAAPHYPTQGLMFRLGIRWWFVN